MGIMMLCLLHHRLHKAAILSLNEMPNCLLCRQDFEPDEITFEQRLIEDTDFCSRCFKDILSDRYYEELTYNLSSIKIH